MKRRIEVGGGYYRKRRGIFVLIPEKWLGRTIHPQSIRKRPSKGGQGRKFLKKSQRRKK